MTRERIKEENTRFPMGKVCAEPEIDAGKRSGWHPGLVFSQVRSRKIGQKLPLDCQRGRREVKKGSIASLERLTAQPKWEMSVYD